MDRVEDIDRDWTGDRLSEREIRAQRVSETEIDVETEKEVSAMIKEYDVCASDRDDERSPPKLELISEYRQPPHHFPPSISQTQPTLSSSSSSSHPPTAMDTSNVRFRPVSVLAQAEMTSTYAILGCTGQRRPELTIFHNYLMHMQVSRLRALVSACLVSAFSFGALDIVNL